jgi:hypothetical protein
MIIENDEIDSETDKDEIFDLDELIQESEKDNDENSYYHNNKFLYEASHLKLFDFFILFVWLCQELNLPKNKRQVLLDFITVILPTSQADIKSYKTLYNILKMMQKKT